MGNINIEKVIDVYQMIDMSNIRDRLNMSSDISKIINNSVHKSKKALKIINSTQMEVRNIGLKMNEISVIMKYIYNKAIANVEYDSRNDNSKEKELIIKYLGDIKFNGLSSREYTHINNQFDRMINLLRDKNNKKLMTIQVAVGIYSDAMALINQIFDRLGNLRKSIISRIG